jgi:hypothetical protein
MSNDIVVDIKRAIETKQPVTRLFNIGGKRCQGSTDEVIDIELISSSVSEPKPGSRWDSSSPATTHRFGEVTPAAPASNFCFPSPSFMPSSADKPRMVPHVSKLVEKVDAAQLPSDLISDLNRRIFFAQIEFVFSILSDAFRILFFEKIGAGTAQAWDYVRRMKSASVTESVGIIDLAIKILGRSRCKAALIVGYLLGLRPEYCFRTFPVKSELDSIIPLHNSQIKELIPKQLVIEGRLYLLKSIDYLNDYRGMKEQAVCLYMDKARPKNKFFLIANRVEKEGSYVLEIGTTPVPARLYSRAEMAIHESATIIICMDMTVAMEFRRIARESSLLERVKIIISGYFGDSSAFESLDVNDTAGHHVVIVYEFTQDGMVSASKLAERCEKAGATSVKIYQWPIFAGGGLAGEDQDCVESLGQDQWKDTLLVQADYLDDIERPSKFARAICNRAVSISDYKKFIIDIGVVTAPLDSSKESIVRNEAEEVSFISLGEISEDNPEDDGPLTLEQLINPENSLVLYGPTGTAKSWATDEVAIGVATGTEAFGIPARRARAVCIMDGEISPQKRKKHIMQLLQTRPNLVALANKNIHVRRPMSGFKRFDAAYADILIPKLKLLNAELFIIDNLQALDPKAGKYSSDNLNEFIQKLEFNGIAVYIVHHSDKEGTTYKGPTDLTDLAQNVFRADGRNQLRVLKNNSEQVEEACKEGGPVIRLTVEKTKICGLDDCSVIYHLPMYGVWEWIEGELSSALKALPESNSGDSNTGEKDSSLVEAGKLIDLSPDEDKVYAFLKEKNYTRPQLEDVTGFKTDKMGKILRRLALLNLVKREGVGKSSYYRVL